MVKLRHHDDEGTARLIYIKSMVDGNYLTPSLKTWGTRASKPEGSTHLSGHYCYWDEYDNIWRFCVLNNLNENYVESICVQVP